MTAWDGAEKKVDLFEFIISFFFKGREKLCDTVGVILYATLQVSTTEDLSTKPV